MLCTMNRLRQWWQKASRRKKVIIGVTAIVIIIIVFLVAKKKAATDEQTALVQQGSVISSVVLSGTTQSASAVNLGFADQGRVAAVNTKEGEKVHAGQVLAILDTSDLQASLKNAQAALVIAKANGNNSSTNLDTVTAQQNTLVQNAYNTLLSDHLQAQPTSLAFSAPAPTISGTYTGPEGAYRVHVYASGTNSGASFSVSGLETGFNQEASVNSAVPLGSHGLYIQFQSGASYAGTDWIVNIPNTQASTYTADKNAYNAAVTTRAQAIAAASASVQASANQASITEAQIQQAQAQVDTVLASIKKREIVAPFDGIIASVNVKPGQTTNSFNPSSSSSDSANANISLISENDYEVVLKTPEIDVASIAVGQPVSLTLDAFAGETFPGTISSINPAETIVDGVPVYQTKVAFTHLDPRIRSGMTATATIVVAQKDAVLHIPASFVQDNSVYVLSDGHTTKQSVTTGLRGSDSEIEITSGLSAGQTVSTNPQ